MSQSHYADQHVGVRCFVLRSPSWVVSGFSILLLGCDANGPQPPTTRSEDSVTHGGAILQTGNTQPLPKNQEPGSRGAPAGAAKETQARGKSEAPDTRAPSRELVAAIKKLKIPGLIINVEERCVDIEATICLDKGMLELVACTKDTKEHESIVVIETRPTHIHTALLLLDAEPGNPPIRQAPRGENNRWLFIPPRGSAVDVLLVFPDQAGKLTEHPISEFITRASAEAEVTRDAPAEKGRDSKFPTHKFLFAGSRLVGDGPGPRKYLSDHSGNVISIVSFGDELLCLSDVHGDQDDSLLWEVNSSRVPAVGTQVTLRLRPQRK